MCCDSRKMRIFAASNIKTELIMAVKKITYEEALERFHHSMEVKRAAKQRMAEAWALEGFKGTPVSL